MATDDLLAALQGLKYAPIESPYGIAGASIAQSLPQMITPTMSTGKALGLSLGSVLLSGLLGYQARRDAAAANLESAKLGLQLQSAMTPEARLGIIENAGSGSMGDLQSRLLDVNNILAAQDLDTKNAIKRAAGLETGKMKALQDFYSTPEGVAQREFELNKIKAEAEARRTGLSFDEQMALVLARNAGGLNKQQQADETKLKIAELNVAAASGDKEKQRQWKAEQDKQRRDFEENLVRLKASVGTDAAISRQQQLNAIKMDNIRNGQDPDLALANARAEINKQMAQDLINQKDELSKKRMQEYNDAVEQRMILRKELEQQYPNVGQQIKNSAADAGSFANLAKSLATDLRKFSSYPEYKTAKNISALGDQIKSRTADIVDRLARVRSGLATRGAEDERMETIALGDSSVGPQEAANILERIANDTLNVAADKLAAGTQSPGALIQQYRKAAQGNELVSLVPNVFQGTIDQTGGSVLQSAEVFVNELKKKYGADWKTKMTPAEKTAAAALLQARGQ